MAKKRLEIEFDDKGGRLAVTTEQGQLRAVFAWLDSRLPRREDFDRDEVAACPPVERIGHRVQFVVHLRPGWRYLLVSASGASRFVHGDKCTVFATRNLARQACRLAYARRGKVIGKRGLIIEKRAV